MLPPKRFRSAWTLAWVASLASAAAAVGPNLDGEYNPNLAVLTLTLIAVIGTHTSPIAQFTAKSKR